MRDLLVFGSFEGLIGEFIEDLLRILRGFRIYRRLILQTKRKTVNTVCLRLNARRRDIYIKFAFSPAKLTFSN